MDIVKLAEEFKERNSYILEGYLHMCQADLDKHRRCLLDVQVDENSYTDGKVVHLGLLTAGYVHEFIMTKYPDLDEMAVFAMINEYLLGHENQHTRSTRDKDYKVAIQMCKQAMLKEISNILKDGKIFRIPKDYDDYVTSLSGKYDISNEKLNRFACYIANSVEDGRIERIRSIKRPGFGTSTRFVRAALYEMHSSECYFEDVDYTPDTMPKSKALIVLLDQVLSLATAGVYERDFFSLFNGTQIGKDAAKLVPFVRAGVNSGCCRGIVDASKGIGTIIAPYLLEAMQKNEASDGLSNAEQRMQETGSGSGRESYNTLGNEEETDEGMPNPVLGTSEEESGNEPGENNVNEQGEAGEEDTGSAEDGDEGDGNDKTEDGKDAGTDEGSDKGKAESEKGDAKDCSSKKENGSDSDATDDSSTPDGDDDENGDMPSKDENTTLNKTKVNKGKRIDNFAKREAHGCDDLEGLTNALEKAMKDAATQMNGLAGQINAFNAESRRKVGAVKETKLPEFKPVATKTVFPGVKFKEVYRKYKLDTPMPYDLQARADKFANDIDELFHNQEIPEVRCMNNGKIDPSGIYKLGLNMIDCFEQEMESPEFDGCAYLLCDNSGSMGYGLGTKRYYANTALAIIEAAFTKHMPVKMAAFDESCGAIIHEVIKNWDEELPVSGAYNFAIKGRGGSGNADAYSIRVATEELLARSEEEKMLVVLSDGAPACVTYTGTITAEEEVRMAVEDARAAGIRVISVFFDTYRDDRIIDAFHFMYGKANSIICDPEYIEDELAELMQTFVFG